MVFVIALIVYLETGELVTREAVADDLGCKYIFFGQPFTIKPIQ